MTLEKVGSSLRGFTVLFTTELPYVGETCISPYATGGVSGTHWSAVELEASVLQVKRSLANSCKRLTV